MRWLAIYLTTSTTFAGIKEALLGTQSAAPVFLPHMMVLQVKMMHINLCMRKAFLDHSAAAGDRFLILLTRILSICAQFQFSPPVVKLINQALPGVPQG